MRSLSSIALIVLGLLLMFGAGGCSDDPLTVQELESLLNEASFCDPGDRCVVVDTYCCPRAINVSMEREVRRALSEVDTGGEVCLADCIAFDAEATATCAPVEDTTRCRIDFP